MLRARRKIWHRAAGGVRLAPTGVAARRLLIAGSGNGGEGARFFVKGSLAGGAMYVAYDQGLLGNGSQGAEALKKARAALPPAIQEWTDYTGWELPSAPKFDFSVSESWNTGVQATVSALSVAPTKVREYTHDGWKYMKDLIK
ncbi:Protein QIL1 [Chelonia mydas]|uniref:MICOS complex subunit MIC13 n=2 Tax=Cheloniidae TaxID=8465 RepID=M7AGY8_CHEMY|nr:Protein QIL1 [Chelonia mydas]